MDRVIEISGEATASAAGEALIRFRGPGRQLRRYLVDLIQLDGRASTLRPTVTLWRSAQPGSSQIAREPDGQSGYFVGGGTGDRIDTGETWTVQFTGATPGALCAATLTGTEIDLGA